MEGREPRGVCLSMSAGVKVDVSLDVDAVFSLSSSDSMTNLMSRVSLMAVLSRVASQAVCTG